MFGRNYIDGSVEWVGIPDLLRNDVPPWTANILDTYHSWGYQGPSVNLDWGSGFGGNSNSISVLWSLPTRVLPIYHWRISENTHSAACRAHDDLLMENRMYHMQSPSTCRNPIHGCLVNQRDDGLDDPWDVLVGNNLSGEFPLVVSVAGIPVTSVSIYHLISFWIAFGVIFF